MMAVLRTASCLLALFLATACAGPFEKGIRLAREGDANAQFWVGAHYHDGIDVEQDYAQAAHWLRLAADQGHVEAQSSLGILYALGAGVEKDPDLARHYLELAAEQGDGAAQYNLAGLYAKGLGVEQDWQEAARLTHLAALQSYEKAYAYLGYLYSEGLGVERDNGEALRWYRIAVESGRAEALPGYAAALLRDGRRREATEIARRAVDEVDNVHSKIVLANLLEVEGAFEEAIDILEDAMQQAPTNAIVLNNLAWLLVSTDDARLRDPERSLELVERAIAASEVPSPDALDTLAEAHFALGDTERAIEAIERALASDPSAESEVIMREHLAKYEAETGRRGAP